MLKMSRERTPDNFPVEWHLKHRHLAMELLNTKYSLFDGNSDKMEPAKSRVNSQNAKGNAPHSEVYAEFKKWWPTVPEGKLFYLEMTCPKMGNLRTTSFHVKTTEMMKVGNDADQGDIERKIKTEWRDYNDNKRFDKFAMLIDSGRKRHGAPRSGGSQSDDSDETDDNEPSTASSEGSFTSLNSGESDLTSEEDDGDEDEEEEDEWTECSTNSEDDDDELFGTDTSEGTSTSSNEETSEEGEEDEEINVPREVLGKRGKKQPSSLLKKGGGATAGRKGGAKKGKKGAANRRHNRRGGRGDRNTKSSGSSRRKSGMDPWVPPQCMGYNYDTFWELNFSDFEPEQAERGPDSFLKRIIRSLILREHTTGSASRCITRLALSEYFEMMDRAGILQRNGITPDSHPQLWTEMIENNHRDIRDVCDKSPVLEINNFGWFDVPTYVQEVWYKPTLHSKMAPTCDSLTRHLTTNKMWSMAGTKAIHRTFGAFRLSLGEWIPTINGEEDFSVVLDEKKLNNLSRKSCTPLLANLMMASAQLVDEAWEYMDNTVSNAKLCFDRLDEESTKVLPMSLATETLWLENFQKKYGRDKYHTLFMMTDQLYKCMDWITEHKVQGSALFPAHRMKYWVTGILNQIFAAYPHLIRDPRCPRGYCGPKNLAEEIRAEDIQLHEALLRDESVPVGGAAADGGPGGTIGRGKRNSLYNDIHYARGAGGVNWLKQKEGLTIPFTTPLQGQLQNDCDYWANFGLNWVTFELSWLRPDHKEYEAPTSLAHTVETTYDPARHSNTTAKSGSDSNEYPDSKTPIFLNAEKLSNFLHRIALFTKGFLLGLMEKTGGYTIQLKYLRAILSSNPEDLGWAPPAWFEDDITALKVYGFGLRATCPKNSALSRELEVLTTLEQVAMVASGVESQGLSSSQLTRGGTRPFSSYKTGSWDSEEKLRALMSIELKRSLMASQNCEEAEYVDMLEGKQGPNASATDDEIDAAATAAALASAKPRKKLSEIRVGEYHAGEILQRGREFQRASVDLVGAQSLGAWTMNSVRTATHLQKIYACTKGSFELFLGNHIMALWELSRVRVSRPSQQMMLITCLLQLGCGRVAREWWKQTAPVCHLSGSDLDIFEKRIPEYCAKYEAKTSQTIDLMTHPCWDKLLGELSPAETDSHSLMTMQQDCERQRAEVTKQIQDDKKEIEAAERDTKAKIANTATLEKALQSEKSKQKKAMEKLKKGKGTELDALQQNIDIERRNLELQTARNKKKRSTLGKARDQMQNTLSSLEAELEKLLEEGGEELSALYQQQLEGHDFEDEEEEHSSSEASQEGTANFDKVGGESAPAPVAVVDKKNQQGNKKGSASQQQGSNKGKVKDKNNNSGGKAATQKASGGNKQTGNKKVK